MADVLGDPPPGPPAATATPAAITATERPATWHDIIDYEAKKQGVDPRLVHAVVKTESDYNPAATSPAGAVGLMQLMPATAAKWKVDPADGVQNIRGGVSELKALLDEHHGDVTLTLRRYNGSPRASAAATQPYVDTVLKHLHAAQQPTPGEDPSAPPPTIGHPPPAAPESWKDWTIRQGKEMAASFDPRTSTGRQNLAGGVGAAGLTTLATATAPVSLPLLGLGAAVAGVVGAFAGGEAANLGEQVVGNAPPSTTSALEAGAGQGFQEAVGRGTMWGVQSLGRRAIAGRVGRLATRGLETTGEALSASKAYTLGKLQDALDASQTLLRKMKATTKEATAQARTSTSQMVTDTANRAKQGVALAEAQGAAGVEAARMPYTRVVGTPPPSPAAAGTLVNEVIQTGGAAKARNIAGQAVDAAAMTGPDVDITALKAEAQQVIERQIRPPAESFPRKGAATVTDEAVTAQSGIAPEQIAAMRAKATAEGPTSNAARNLADLTAAVTTAQGEAAQETLKHPAMGVLSRIMNAADSVPFKDAHLWKVELDNAIRNTRDQSVRSQVASLTQKFTGTLRETLRAANHAPYEAATAAYAKIAPLYTKAIAAQLKKVAVTNPESIIGMLSPTTSSTGATRARMLVDLLTQQAEAGGDAEGGRAALDAVQAAWVRKKIIDGGIEKLGDRVDKLPPDFRAAFLSTGQAPAVLDRLKLIHTAFKTAQLTSEQGVEATARAGQQDVQAATARAIGMRASTRQAGAQQVEQAAAQVAPARRAIGAAREGFAAQEGILREQQAAFAKSSLAPKVAPGIPVGTQADLLRVAAMAASGGVSHSYYGALSLARLLKGPTANDLVHWAASSDVTTRAFVTAMTSSVPGAALADLVRASGILNEAPRKATAKVKHLMGQPPPLPAGSLGAPAEIGTPPPS